MTTGGGQQRLAEWVPINNTGERGVRDAYCERDLPEDESEMSRNLRTRIKTSARGTTIITITWVLESLSPEKQRLDKADTVRAREIDGVCSRHSENQTQ